MSTLIIRSSFRPAYTHQKGSGIGQPAQRQNDSIRHVFNRILLEGLHKIIEPQHEGNRGEIICLERLGGLLKSYHRTAA